MSHSLSVDLCRENIGRKPRTDAFGNAVRSDPDSNSLTLPSGNFILIISILFLKHIESAPTRIQIMHQCA